MPEIRKARPEDAAACTALARTAYASYVPLIGRDPPPMLQEFPADIAAGRVWVAGNPPEGYVVAYPKDAESWLLENVAVAPDAQGKGLGRRLISHAEQMAQGAGAKAVVLYTNARMEANLRLYPRLGYVETGASNEHGLDRVYFRKLL